MCAEALDSLWLTSLSRCVNSRTNSDTDLYVFEIFVNREEHFRVHRQNKVEKVMVLRLV